jgi:HTH-type transcriptional regulator / antitoxin MqsA
LSRAAFFVARNQTAVHHTFLPTKLLVASNSRPLKKLGHRPDNFGLWSLIMVFKRFKECFFRLGTSSGSTMLDAPLSPVTGKPMVRDERAMKLSYKGHSVTIKMPGWYCVDSDESIHSGKDMKISDAALKDLKVKADDLLSPKDVRRIRTKLGLTQRQASELLGGGPNAFQKYESGEVLVSKAIANLLRVLEQRPQDLAILKRHEKKRAATAGA